MPALPPRLLHDSRLPLAGRVILGDAMPSLVRSTMLAAVLISLTGCHARYKKMAPRIGSVRPVVATPSAPSLNLGSAVAPSVGTGTVVGDVVEVVVAAGAVTQGPKAHAKLRRAVKPDDVAAALQAALMEAPGEAAVPHAIGSNGKHVMRVEVTDYGIDVSSGAPEFFTSVSVRIDRKRDGKRIYRASTTCTESIGSMPNIPISAVEKLQTLQGLAEVTSLTNKELRAIAMNGIERCGERVVERMVRHAG
jgi:hypothetical protein